jgi:hypothetical protein
MQKTQKKWVKNNPERKPEPFNLFTGSKSAAFAIYYNMACDNVDEIIEKLEGRKTNIESAKDATFIALRNYLWKGYEFNKNKSGYSLIPEDKTLIIRLCLKLDKLRNFHSHIWHDNTDLEFDQALVCFIEEKRDVALAEARNIFSLDDIRFFEDKLEEFPFFFKSPENKYFLTPEGRCFFLSLFLLKGQMNAFLQQYSGSKRNDVPAFKVKRNIYTYYCHNDGASVTGFHITETAFDAIKNEQEKKEILKARQGYKIISYLNDIPAVLSNTSLLPLYLEENKQLIRCETVQQLVQFCRNQGIFEVFAFTEIDLKHLDENEVEKTKREGDILFCHNQIKEYRYMVSREHLHKLIIQRLLQGAGYETFVTKKLTDFSSERLQLFNFLVQQHHQPKQDDVPVGFTDEELRGVMLRGDTKLQVRFAQWMDNWLKQYKLSSQSTWNLVNSLRPLTHKPIMELKELAFGASRPGHAATESSPIVLLSQYFFMGDEKEGTYDEASATVPKIRLQQKPRVENNFVRYAVKFLIEHEVVKGWKWQVERFVTEPGEAAKMDTPEDINRPIKRFLTDVPDGWQLSLKNDHVLVGIDKKNGEGQYLFGLGPNTLRYMLACYMLNNDKGKLNNFLAYAMPADMEKLLRYSNGDNEPVAYNLLEEQYIPPVFHNYRKMELAQNPAGNPGLLAQLKKDIKRKIEWKEKELNNISNGQKRLRKAEKNRIIMECYKLFDWSRTSGSKFLRASEYNELSVCHYLLHDDDKFNHLFIKQFNLGNRVPEEVKDLLRHSRTMNELFDNTLNRILTYLKELKGSIPADDLPQKIIKKELLNAAKILDIHVPDELLGIDDLESRKTERKRTFHILPFDIHPNLVLKYFYKEEYAAGFFKYNSLYKQLHTPENIKGLYEAHYDIRKICTYYEQAAEIVPEPGQKNEAVLVLKKIKGEINTCFHEDILLWFIAKEYLQNNIYTSERARDIQKCLLTAGEEITVKNLHTGLVKLPVSKNGQPDYFISLRMHQLDDLLFQSNVQKLHDAVTHFIKRQVEEKLPCEEPMNSDKAISFDLVIREIQKVRRDGQVLCGHLLNWETLVINDYCKQRDSETPAQKQALLINEIGEMKGLPHLKFNKVIEMAKELGYLDEIVEVQINDTRNQLLHSNIPVNGSFKFNTLMETGGIPTALGALLHIQEPIDTRKDRSKYELKNEL